MLDIEITPAQSTAVTRSGTTQDGRAYSIRQQNAYAFLGGDYPELFTFRLNEDQAPYPAGYYTLDPSSLTVGNYNRLSIGFVKLIPKKS